MLHLQFVEMKKKINLINDNKNIPRIPCLCVPAFPTLWGPNVPFRIALQNYYLINKFINE